MNSKISKDVDSFGIPKPLTEMARLGDLGQYSFWVYSDPLKNPSFHVRHKTDFEIVIQAKDLTVLEIKNNASRYKFKKGEQPPTPVMSVINQFMSAKNSKKPSMDNAEAFDFAWKLLND